MTAPRTPGALTRPATVVDVPAMLALFDQVYGRANATSEVEDSPGLRQAVVDGRAVVAVTEGQVVGYIARRPIAPDLLGDGTFLVRPDLRGIGVGTLLLAAFRELVAGRWAASLVMNSTGYLALDPTKRSAVAVYVRAGWTVLADTGTTVVLWSAHPALSAAWEPNAEVVLAAQTECERQHVGPDRVAMLLAGYGQARQAAQARALPTLEDAMAAAAVVEPSSRGRFRLVPVVFADGGTAAPADTVPAVTSRMFEVLDEGTDPDEFVRSFLSVHPFLDGNGRVAWVLRTWLTNTWSTPAPLPDYHW